MIQHPASNLDIAIRLSLLASAALAMVAATGTLARQPATMPTAQTR